MRKTLAAVCFTTLLSACTTIDVKKVEASRHPLKLVCIQENPKVLVDDLLSCFESEFQSRGISTTIYTGDAPSQCEYTMWYTAFRGWDFVPFLRLVELRLNYGEDTIASAKYKHTGGFALNKWASTESKLSPLFDKLLTDFRAK